MTARQCVGRPRHDSHGQLGDSSTTEDRIQYGAMTAAGVPGVVANVGHSQVTNLHKSAQLKKKRNGKLASIYAGTCYHLMEFSGMSKAKGVVKNTLPTIWYSGVVQCRKNLETVY